MGRGQGRTVHVAGRGSRHTWAHRARVSTETQQGSTAGHSQLYMLYMLYMLKQAGGEGQGKQTRGE